MSDPVNWAQPRFAESPRLDGSPLSHYILTDADKRVVLGAPSIFRMASGIAVIQRPFVEDSQSELVRFYEWELDQEGGSYEGDWNAVTQKMARGASVTWIDFDVETEAFVLAGGSESFTLQRPTAVSVYTSFDTTSYPNVALLDGTAQTVVTTGSPTSGQVSVSGSTVVVPSTVTAGQLLELRYYPSYNVVAMPSGPNGLGYNRLARTLTLVEV